MTDQPAEERQPSALRLGIIALLLSVTLFAAVDGVSKAVVAEQSFGQILLARYGLGLPGPAPSWTSNKSIILCDRSYRRKRVALRQ